MAGRLLPTWFNGFESAGDRAQWFPTPAEAAGFDTEGGMAHSGIANGWVRPSDPGWKALNTIQPTGNTRHCVLTAWIAASSTVIRGPSDFAVWTLDVKEHLADYVVQPGNDGDYVPVTLCFDVPKEQQVLIDVGLWGADGWDQWIRVDDFSMTCF